MWTLLLATAALAGQGYVIDGSNAATGHACAAGEAVTVNGSSLTVRLTGDCGVVEVVGSTNHVTVDGVASVRVTGSDNDVTWARNLSGSKRLPKVLVGTGNKVHR
ncbi:MAG: DUF3060 domain-containing protein [Myxococcota bacterium]